jgi:hypothetical protein
MKKNFLLFSIVIFCSIDLLSQCSCSSGTSVGLSNGDYSNEVFNLPKGKFAIEGYGDYRTFIKIAEEHHHDMETMDSIEMTEERHLENMFISSLGVKFGITNRIMVSALIPYVFLKTDQGNSRAFGDLVLLGTLGLYSKNDLNIAVSTGVEITTKKRRNPSFENTTVTVSSGSIDPMLGISASKKWNRVILQVSSVGKYTTQGFDKTNYGSVNAQNIAISYLLKSKTSNCSSDSVMQDGKPKLAVFGGYYGEWLGQIDKEGEKDQNTGYYLGFATIGSSLTFKGFSIPLTCSFPFIQDIRGEQVHSGYRIRLGIVKIF